MIAEQLVCDLLKLFNDVLAHQNRVRSQKRLHSSQYYPEQFLLISLALYTVTFDLSDTRLSKRIRDSTFEQLFS